MSLSCRFLLNRVQHFEEHIHRLCPSAVTPVHDEERRLRCRSVRLLLALVYLVPAFVAGQVLAHGVCVQPDRCSQLNKLVWSFRLRPSVK